MADLMKGSINRTIRFLLEEDGPTPVEYATALLLILMGGLTALNVFSQ